MPVCADTPPGPAVVSGLADIGEYLISDGSPVNGTEGGYAERYIHSEILKKYPDVNAVVHSHSEDVLPYTVIDTHVEPVYHMAGFLGTSERRKEEWERGRKRGKGKAKETG